MTNLPPMPNTPPAPVSKPGPKRRNLIIAAAVAVALLIGGGIYWLTQPSYDDIVKSCQKALTAQMEADGRGKPDACNGVNKDDYDALVISAAIDGMSKTDKDTLDYFDNGTIDGSLD